MKHTHIHMLFRTGGNYDNYQILSCSSLTNHYQYQETFFQDYLKINPKVGPYSPIANALVCEASVTRSVHSCGELIWCITWTDNMLWPGGYYGLRGILFMNLGIWHLWRSMIFGLRWLTTVIPICYHWNPSVI